jgi:hypothetical protein
MWQRHTLRDDRPVVPEPSMANDQAVMMLLMQTEVAIRRGDIRDGMLVDEDVSGDLHENREIVE